MKDNKKKQTVGETYKRKSNVGGWILFAVVVAVLVWYWQLQPGGENSAMGGDPDDALQYYAQMAYKVSKGETGRDASIDKLLALCTQEDRDWFDSNYARIYSQGPGQTIGANPSYIEKRNYAIREIIGKGLDRSDYKIKQKRELNRTVEYTLEIPGPYNTTRTVRVSLRKEKGVWKMLDLGGGK